jgi:hypothetical protein
MPTFTSITPSTGLISGGQSVTIVGTGFVSGTSLAVSIGGRPATSVAFGSSTSLTAVTPSGTAGSTWVNITNGNGGFVNTSGAYTYQAPYVAITPSATSLTMKLISNQTSVYSNFSMTASTNVPFTITVADSNPSHEYPGHMQNYTTTYVSSPLDTALAAPISLAGSSNSTVPSITAHSITLPSGSLLYSGNAAVTNQFLANTFTQPVVITDPVLPNSNVYRIDLTFTITPS